MEMVSCTHIHHVNVVSAAKARKVHAASSFRVDVHNVDWRLFIYRVSKLI
jgi:hypothetical protein